MAGTAELDIIRHQQTLLDTIHTLFRHYLIHLNIIAHYWILLGLNKPKIGPLSREFMPSKCMAVCWLGIQAKLRPRRLHVCQPLRSHVTMTKSQGKSGGEALVFLKGD